MLSLVLLAPQVTLAGLIQDMTDPGTLTRYPDPAYITRQASSYDRASVKPGDPTWFANADAGQFIRHESVDGRMEHVLMDASGPGCIVRIWSPNPAGVLRVYLDGDPKPALIGNTAALLSGQGGFPSPLAEVTSSGWTLHYPITYQKSAKVTVDDSDKDAGGKMYYQVQYRTYSAGTSVEPFSVNSAQVTGAAQKLTAAVDKPPSTQDRDWTTHDLAMGSFGFANGRGPGVITEIAFQLPPEPKDAAWTDPRRWHNILRSQQMIVKIDGEKCVDAPLGDFMGVPVGVWPLKTLPQTATKDGLLVFRLPMPYRDGFNIEVECSAKVRTVVKMAVKTAPYRWDDRSMHLYAQWKAYKGGTRPMADLEFLRTTGKGVYVGCNVSVDNPVAAWWGEGDEKISIDGEGFPSTFGTGTEDFFGYGWCDPHLFMHPFRSQGRCDGPGNKGHTCVSRFQYLDRLPFTNQFHFDLELWHWADCQVQYGRTVYWYAMPGSAGPQSDEGVEFLPPFIDGPVKVKGAVEGEEATILEKSGGETEVQGFDGLSGGKQIWWRDAKQGDRLVLDVPVAASGRYRIIGKFCFARDYGVHKMTLGDLSFKQDFFGELGWKSVELGKVDLKQGKARFTVENTGSNPKAEPRRMFGLDYLLLLKE